MKYKTWCETKEIELNDCPFCGGEPKVSHIGNDHTKKRKIEIKCSKCRIKRTDAALIHSFSWLEDVSAKNWNQQKPEVLTIDKCIEYLCNNIVKLKGKQIDDVENSVKEWRRIERQIIKEY